MTSSLLLSACSSRFTRSRSSSNVPPSVDLVLKPARVCLPRSRRARFLRSGRKIKPPKPGRMRLIFPLPATPKLSSWVFCLDSTRLSCGPASAGPASTWPASTGPASGPRLLRPATPKLSSWVFCLDSTRLSCGPASTGPASGPRPLRPV